MGKNVTKKDLIVEVAERTSFTATDVRPMVEALLQSITGALLRGCTIEIRGFGTFAVRRRKGRPARNPHTGEALSIPERRVPVLQFSQAVREAVDNTRKRR